MLQNFINNPEDMFPLYYLYRSVFVTLLILFTYRLTKRLKKDSKIQNLFSQKHDNVSLQNVSSTYLGILSTTCIGKGLQFIHLQSHTIVLSVSGVLTLQTIYIVFTQKKNVFDETSIR